MKGDGKKPPRLMPNVPAARSAAGMPELTGSRPHVWFFGASRLGNQTFDRQIFMDNRQLRRRYPLKICPSTRALGSTVKSTADIVAVTVNFKELPMTTAQTTTFASNSSRIFVFDEVYPLRAAQEQAEKKKLKAFGMLAKYNPLNRPKEETVLLSREELRYEPFWHITAMRSVDYHCQVNYQVPVHNPYAQFIEVDKLSFDVTRQKKDKARIEFTAIEHCHRKIPYDTHIDGMKREIKAEILEGYIKKYKYTEVDHLEKPQLLKPLLTLAGATQLAMSQLSREAINATDVASDRVEFERTHLYTRPVYAFEFRWSTADKVGVIEVDGLTGEVVENGSWFVEKITQRLTRDRLIDLGSELVNLAVPGGGLVIKAVGYATDNSKDFV